MIKMGTPERQKQNNIYFETQNLAMRFVVTYRRINNKCVHLNMFTNNDFHIEIFLALNCPLFLLEYADVTHTHCPQHALDL